MRTLIARLHVGLLALALMAIAAPNTLGAPPSVPTKSASPLLDLNTATESQLQTLPGVGEATAKKIVAGRPYASVEDLTKTGLSKATIEKIKPLMMVQPAAARKLKLDQSYVARTIRLASLSPENIESILDGDEPERVGLNLLRHDLPLLWNQQRRQLMLAAAC